MDQGLLLGLAGIALTLGGIVLGWWLAHRSDKKMDRLPGEVAAAVVPVLIARGVARPDDRAALMHALDSLSDTQKRVLYYHLLADMPLTEVAIRIRRPVGEVEAILAQSIKDMRQLLGRDQTPGEGTP